MRLVTSASLAVSSRRCKDTLRGIFFPRTRLRFLRSCDGATAAEFSLVALLFLMFVFGIVTFGWIFFLVSNMESAAREAARRMAVAEATFAGTNVTCGDTAAQVSGSAEQLACALLGWSGAVTVNATDLCPAERSVRVQITADAGQAAILDILGLFDGKTLSTEVTLRKEAACA